MEDVNYEFMAIATADGIALGMIIGLLTNNLEFWLALGNILGLSFGLFYPVDRDKIDLS